MPRMSPSHRKHPRTLTVICLVWTLAVAALHLTEQRFDHAEQAARDWLTTNGAAHLSPQNPDLVFLGIDDASKTLDTSFAVFPDDFDNSRGLQLMREPFPWNREVYALLIDRLAQAGAKAIVLDMMFPAPRSGDQPFREALGKWHSRVVIGTNLKDTDEDPKDRKSVV